MADTNAESTMQERQKTVIAFVAGLLIGGLLVWVFTASPAGRMGNDNGEAMHDDASMEEEGAMEGEGGSSMNDGNGALSGSGTVVVPTPNGDGELRVGDQAAGTLVALGSVGYPTEEGWIVVKDYAGGEGGRTLGAARYNTNVGLVPNSVELLRSTEAGNAYMVVFYTENGDRVFDTSSDGEMSGTASAVFMAQ